ncbi:MAG: hypothetical protein JWQ71_831, partial [Pedosphaera sp.]|nr:hypothetical protein [Pedosphaera sp.]
VWHPDRFPNDAKMQHKAQERLKTINGAYEVLSQFLASDTRPRAEQPNSSGAHDWGEGTAPPVPPAAEHENKIPATHKKSNVKIIFLLVLALGLIVYAVNISIRYHAFSNQLNAAQGISIGDSREEVKYRLGFPKEVISNEEYKGFNWVYTVNAPTNDVNRMPQATKVEDYNEWIYEEASSNVRLTVEFNKSNLVESLNLYSRDYVSFGWRSVAGLSSGDSEDKVRRLGAPSHQILNGVSKTIEYDDLGIAVTLSKGRAYMISIKGPQKKAAVFWRFVHTLP